MNIEMRAHESGGASMMVQGGRRRCRQWLMIDHHQLIILEEIKKQEQLFQPRINGGAARFNGVVVDAMAASDLHFGGPQCIRLYVFLFIH